MNNRQTSRHKLFDTEVRITELELLVDHYIEVLLGYESKRTVPVNIVMDDQTEVMDSAEDPTMGIKIDAVKSQLQHCVSLRRDLMTQLETEYGANHFEWCPYKHSRKEFGLAKEDYVAHLGTEHEPFYLKALQRSFEIYIGSTSIFLGHEYVTCGRCLADQLAGN